MDRTRAVIDSNALSLRPSTEPAGKLTAEVVAPPGTKIKIAGTGAFQKTELTRHFTVSDVGKAVKPPARPAAAAEEKHVEGGPR